MAWSLETPAPGPGGRGERRRHRPAAGPGAFLVLVPARPRHRGRLWLQRAMDLASADGGAPMARVAHWLGVLLDEQGEPDAARLLRAQPGHLERPWQPGRAGPRAQQPRHRRASPWSPGHRAVLARESLAIAREIGARPLGAALPTSVRRKARRATWSAPGKRCRKRSLSTGSRVTRSGWSWTSSPSRRSASAPGEYQRPTRCCLPPSTTRSAPAMWKSWSHRSSWPPASPRSPAMACGRRGSPARPKPSGRTQAYRYHHPTRPSWSGSWPWPAPPSHSCLGGRAGGRHSAHPAGSGHAAALARLGTRLARLTPEPCAIVLAARRAARAGGRTRSRPHRVDCLTHQPPLSSISAEVASVRPPPRPGPGGRSRTFTGCRRTASAGHYRALGRLKGI